MVPRIKDIETTNHFKIIILFDNGVKKIYDMKKKFNDDSYELLKYLSFFRTARIDKGGYAISWNDDIDISENELWMEATYLQSYEVSFR